ncbi:MULTISPECIES: serine hydrolase [Enterococcus]|uniref:serine-type D-Ala-D-Ala carboxypeptidase n=1 Tax=Enterococcus mundtii TaxID=53346 RepID=A0A1V2UMW3_ENTMU|nr:MULTISPECIES: serine hydrolase [Enterococcus]MBE6172894.1 D-alanyl-D-alanine carboxypeptidase [Enterococcus faecium]MBE9911358.1 D-alanyl-D-alanine carboxypeptidase [Enterococcus mundtii]MCA6772853.1 D-alanyl-D-alanine carboxypeptidase [Enterococcus mundtii]MRI73829.1 D-alanyl-D-alanine carboxypeptidase [Enterococcus mundtii]ONN44778.1 D-alanyl-D-alanine carboxypeptidase [Enterococcus mundtii]
MGTKKKHFALLLATLLLTLGSFLPTLSVQADEAFSVNSQAAFAVDATSGKILYDQDGEKTMGIASISKIIGLYIVLDQVKEGKLSWDDEVAISDYAETLSIAPNLSNVPLHKENTYTVKELFDSAFIQSANASMVALAEKISGSETAFLTVMNDQLKEWGIENATIVNVSGLNNVYLGANRPEGTGEADENQMSAKDVAIIARHLLLDFPEVLEVTSTATKMFGENTQSPVEMVNWNWMLPGFINFKEGVDGLKTGTTDFAGACFVGTIERDGKRIITVILNAEGHEQNPSVRFTETARLMDYCYDNWSVKEIGKANASIPSLKSIDVKNGKETSVNVVLKSPVSVWVRNDMDTGQLTITPKIDETKVKDNELEAPIVRGTKVGTATITLADDQLGYLEDGASPSTDIITASSVEKANIFVIGWRNVTNFFSNLF